MYYVRKEISSIKIFISGWKYLLASAIMLAVLLFENTLLPSSIINTSLMILSGVVVYAATLLIVRDKLFAVIIQSIFNKIFHKEKEEN